MRLPIVSLTVIFFIFLFIACEENDSFSNSPGLRLDFSSDTISFDTVFTTIGSSRRGIMLYNNNKNSLNINSAKVMNAEKTGFSMLLDGVSGTEINNVDILKKDSLYLWVMVRVDPLNKDNPVIISDSIRFEVNGSYQYIHLEAIGQDVHMWHGRTISRDTTLRAEKPFLVYDSLVIGKNVKLDIEQNVHMYFHGGAGVKVFGTINAVGTVEEPVVFRGDRTDRLFTDVPYDRVPGQWEGIIVDSLSFNNYFENFHLRNSTNGILFEPSDLSEKKAVLVNSIIHNTTIDGLSAENCDIEAYNSLFSNSVGSTVKLIGGRYKFLHCTLANYMNFWTSRKDAALIIGNVNNEQHHVPLLECSFINSIIAGAGNSSIRLRRAEGNQIPFTYAFRYCLSDLDADDEETDDGGSYEYNIWKQNPAFISAEKSENYYYNFQLDAESPAINEANYTYSMEVPYDMLGRSRLADGRPDIGCYEWVPEEEAIP